MTRATEPAEEDTIRGEHIGMRQSHLHATLAGGAQVIAQLLHSDVRPAPPAAVDSAEGAATDLGAHLNLCCASGALV